MFNCGVYSMGPLYYANMLNCVLLVVFLDLE
jgi:hypothetical protein